MPTFRQKLCAGLSVLLVVVVVAIIHLDDLEAWALRLAGDEIVHFRYSQQDQVKNEGYTEFNTTGGSFDFRIRSFNVRVDTFNRFPHEHHWNDRRGGVIASLRAMDPHVPTVLGLQEAKHHQLSDIIKGLNGDAKDEIPWTHYGVGRDDGATQGEYAPIVYNSHEWTLLNGTSRWLSAHTHSPERSWGAATKRIITFATLQHRQSGYCINFINTHLDHKSRRAKTKSAHLILDWIESIPNEYPTFLSGDFNSLSDGIAYGIIATKMQDANLMAHTHLNDTQNTYTGFEVSQTPTVIDFLWSSSHRNCAIEVGSFAVLSNEHNGVRFSDHRPIEAEFAVSEGVKIEVTAN
ncbi:Endonuclease/exonuclease/phosphatase domain-containing protein [[Candida] zeylanoides]